MADGKIEKLKAQKKIIEARIKQEQNRDRTRVRKADTRRKILAGAWVLDEAASRPDFKEFLYRKLDSFLAKPEDRALFGLPPQKEKPVE